MDGTSDVRSFHDLTNELINYLSKLRVEKISMVNIWNESDFIKV